MPIPTIQPALVAADPSPVVSTADAGALMFERLARDPDVSVDKIERLMALWERGEARKAETAFNVGMAQAQHEMRPVAADAYNPSTKSKYASYEQLDRALRPIYTKHGFALSFNTGDAPQADYVRVLCEVTHLGGHCKSYKVDMPADGKGAKGGDVMTKTHATGSALTYGMRYLLKAIFNIAVGEHDDDGNRAAGVGHQSAADVQPPAGYEDWLADMAACADEGWTKLSGAWSKSKTEYCQFTTRHNKEKWEALKSKAQAVTSAAKGGRK